MKKLSLLIATLLLTALPAATHAVVTETPVVEWVRQFGTTDIDQAFDVSVDSSGNAYVTGHTYGDLHGNINEGPGDMFLTKYDAHGTRQWTQLLGTRDHEYGLGVSLDFSGNAYVVGSTEGRLDGSTNTNRIDMFLTKYDTTGNSLWLRQLGSPNDDRVGNVAVDNNGSAYVTMYTSGDLDGKTNQGGRDVFLIKYDSNGTKQWTEQLATDRYDDGQGVSVDDSGNAYVTGYTYGGIDGNTNQGECDLFLAKYDSNGTRQWTSQLGTSQNDGGDCVSIDGSGNAYVTGYTNDGLDGNTYAGGNGDVFLTKYDTDGVKQWTQQLGTSESDRGRGVSVDSGGNAYVTGYTRGGLDGNENAGGSDLFLTKYDTTGTRLWTKQLGTSETDIGWGVSLDSGGNAYVTGWTTGGFDDNVNSGRDDAFLIKISTVPEPSTLALLCVGMLGFLAHVRRRR